MLVARDDYLSRWGSNQTICHWIWVYSKGMKLDEFEDLDVFLVEKFKEKPDHSRAKAMVSDGQHVWNSGMFIWQVDTVMDEFERQMPELFMKITAN